MSTLYREKAIEKLHTSEQANEALTIMSLSPWIGITGTLVVVCTFILYYTCMKEFI